MGRRAGKPERGHPPWEYGYSIVQNLKDAGWGGATALADRGLQDPGEKEQQLRLLFGHRKQLLDELHREEKRIDCLDYLIYQLEKR